MKMKFDFTMTVWLQDVEIEGDSEENCLEILRRQSAERILEQAVIRDSDIDNIDGEIIEQEYKVKVTDIELDITTEDVLYELEKEGITNPSPEEIENKLVELEQSAPYSVTLIFTCAPEYLEECILDELSDRLDMIIKDYSYKVLEKN